MYEVAAILYSLLREDLIFADEHCYQYTCVKKQGFYSYSDLFKMKFPSGYICDKNGRIAPSTARVLNLKELMGIYKSKDPSVFDNNQSIWDGEFRFLDGEKIDRRIGFTSYPRSGNSFLRRYVEQITGVTTGSTISLHSSTSL